MNVTINGEIGAVLTTDHPSSNHGLPVLVIDGTAYGPGDALARGWNVLIPDDGLTEETGKTLVAYWSQMPLAGVCLRCGWAWIRRSYDPPAQCPRCRSAKWRTVRNENETGRKPSRY